MSTAESTLSNPPVIRITPPSNWWVIPVRELWDYRELLYFFVWRDIKIRYKQTAVGAAWAVLQPFLTMVIFSLFFGVLAHIPSQGLPYPIFYYSALLPWMYFAGSLQNATNTIVDNQRVITKVYFPRLDLPISAVLSGLVDFAISFLMFAAMMAYYHVRPTLAILWMPAFLLMALLAALGVGLWLSALNAIYRDVRYVIPFLIQFWLFASPVVYPSSLVAAKWPKWQWLYALNPMVGVIEGFRWSLAGQGKPPGELVMVSSGVVLVLVVSGLAYFQKMETTVADVV
ncbi:MAG TPA: ABC transporter permease [Candidatus Limnocylindrales bacterium]|nr:ABC transporter permease [Candidatus Limnocylindrales bacterium]